MDKINVTQATLSKSASIINDFNNEVSAITNSFENGLNSLISGLDEKTKKEVNKIAEDLKKLCSQVNTFYSVNVDALEQRKKIIEEYEKQIYVQNTYNL